MKRLILFALIIINAIAIESFAQAPLDIVVQLEARIDSSLGRKDLVLRWLPHTNVSSINVFRRSTESIAWGAAKRQDNGATEYRDSTIELGKKYIYRVTVVHPVGGQNRTAQGYLEGGIEVLPIRDRGQVVVLVDATYADSLSEELFRLEADLVNEGWLPTFYNIPRSYPITSIKELLTNIYFKDPGKLKALFIFGHVPVPYSGYVAYDGHPDHRGAWPADCYYGEFDGLWTDDYSMEDAYPGIDTNSIRVANRNNPGDGKFDQWELPDDVDIAVGRVDLHDMPAFGKSEKELLKQYLDKNHNYRTGILTAPHRALVDDNFGWMGGEAFASSGWRNFAPIVGIDSLKELDWFNTLSVDPYLWAYGTGGGSNTSAGGIGTTSDFASKGSKAVFTMLFGSYFGDWNVSNNFLRAPLASEYGLSSSWSGRPYWHYFPMALGETLGDCALITQNNNGLYLSANFPYYTHNNLMGDPTLRLQTKVVIAPKNLTAQSNTDNSIISLSWEKPGGNNVVDGYFVYRSSSKLGPFHLLTPTPVKDLLTFDDTAPMLDTNWYSVHATSLVTTPSGSYYELSPGIYASSIGDGKVSVSKDVVFNTNSLRVTRSGVSTHIVFHPERDASYQIQIIDGLGRIVTTIHNGFLSASNDHRFDWSNGNVPSGLYFVRVTGAGIALSQKVVIVQ